MSVKIELKNYLVELIGETEFEKTIKDDEDLFQYCLSSLKEYDKLFKFTSKFTNDFYNDRWFK